MFLSMPIMIYMEAMLRSAFEPSNTTKPFTVGNQAKWHEYHTIY